MSNCPFIRYALVRGARDRDHVDRYMPGNYETIWCGSFEGRAAVVIAGRDAGGWTLDSYVIPRLGSGLMFAEEIDLSHPLMSRVPA